MSRARKSFAKLIARVSGPPYRAARLAAKRCPRRYQGRCFRDYTASWRARWAREKAERRTRSEGELRNPGCIFIPHYRPTAFGFLRPVGR